MNTAKFDSFDTKEFQRFSNPMLLEKDLQNLVGILRGITCDNHVNDKEYTELMSWVKSVKPYENKRPYCDILAVIREALSDNLLTSEESDNIIWLCNNYIEKNNYYGVITSGVQQLLGIVHGISLDQEINAQEMTYLDKWLEENDYLKNTWPYDELHNITTSILQDKVITKAEHDDLLSFCNVLTSHKTESNEALANSLKRGFYQIDPTIIVHGRTFCITGVSKKYKRREIAEKIELFGGYVVENVSSKLDYLIVCDEKNTCWAYTCYGRKIEEATYLRQSGQKLVIAHEFDLYDELETLEARQS